MARLGYMTGAVSMSPSGESDWVLASVNRPMTTGDRVWVDAGGRAEIQVGGALLRLSEGTGVAVLNLDDRVTQLQLSQGAMNVRVRRLDANQVLEVDTPNLAFTFRKPGEFRIEVEADGNGTTVVVRSGQGEAFGESASYLIDSRQPYRFTGTGLRDYEAIGTPRPDDLDRWSGERDRVFDNSLSARYVSQDVVGYQDLDSNGSWRIEPSYGSVWFPTRVDADWAPYRDGHWAWVDPWGWTWVDDAPWGFAVSHYGRWANVRGAWGWVPGPMRSRAYYAPALVVFVGGDPFQVAAPGGSVGWFALGPREVYRPWYPVSRGYYDNVNRSNTIVDATIINNTYNTNVSNVVYANRRVAGAVVAVPTTAFVQSQPVSRSALRVSRDMAAAAPVVAVAPVAPTGQSVRGAAGPGGKPPARAFERPVVVRTTPPAAPSGFAAQQQQLTANRGKPLDDAARKEIKPSTATQAPVVNVVVPRPGASPSQRPPAIAAIGKPDDARVPSRSRNAGATAEPMNSPVAPAPKPSTAGAPTPDNGPGRIDARERDKPAKPVATPVNASAPAAPPPIPPRAAAPAAESQPPLARGKPDSRSGAMQRPDAAPMSLQVQAPAQPVQAPDRRTESPVAAPQARVVVPPSLAPQPPASQPPPAKSTRSEVTGGPGAQPAPDAPKGRKGDRAGRKDDDEKPGH